MIGTRVLGIPLHRRAIRRRFVIGYWLAVLAALAVLWRFPMPPDVAHWSSFVPLLLTLAVAGNLPLILGGFSHVGAVAFYEGRTRADVEAWIARHPGRTRLLRLFWRMVPRAKVERLRQACAPVDEREAQLRDWAYRRGFRLMMWMVYGGAVAYLALAGVDASLLPRFGFVLLELLLVASLSLPQSVILWTVPDLEPSVANETLEVPCEQN